VFHDGKPRIVDIKGIAVEAEFSPSMIYVTNEDKPGFIGRFAGLLGEAGVNIATFKESGVSGSIRTGYSSAVSSYASHG
jgi:glycine cleavage system regulatory protein